MRGLQATGGASLSSSNPGQADAPATEEPSDGPRRRRIGTLAAVATSALAIDVVTKVVAVTWFADRPPIRLLDGLLTLRLVRNAGAAFGIATGFTLVLTLVAFAVMLVILRTATRLRSTTWAVALGLLLGGAAGNLVDRLLREPGPMRGHVVDWIELPYWPVFNMADTAIVCGGLLAVLLATRGVQVDGSHASARHE